MNIVQSLKGLAAALFAPAEDPRKTLAYTYHHQNELLGKVREGVLSMHTARQRLIEKIDAVKQRIPELETEAQTALQQDDEPRARLILQRQQIARVELEGLESQLVDVDLEAARLARIEQRLTMQIEALLARQELVSARQSAAEAQVYINLELGTVSEELAELDGALADAEARAEELRQRAAALDQIAALNALDLPDQTLSARLEDNIEYIPLADEVEESLAHLKESAASTIHDDV